MTEIMTASVEEITDGQIDTAVDQLRAAMRKHRREIPKDAAQQALGIDNLGMRMFAVFRDIAQAMGGLIIRIVKVDRSQTPRQALKATGRSQYVDDDVVDAMPRGEGDEAELIYFKPDPSLYKNGKISCDAVAAEYEKRGLVPDPMAQAADNQDDAFADKTPNGCQWKDKDGNYCYAAFSRWGGRRRVGVHRFDDDWDGSWSFAGVRKKSSASAL